MPANIKVLQKLGLAEFRKLNAQFKSEGVAVVEKFQQNIVQIGSIEHIGIVKALFNLGKKIEVTLSSEKLADKKNQFRFVEAANRYYLVRSNA